MPLDQAASWVHACFAVGPVMRPNTALGSEWTETFSDFVTICSQPEFPQNHRDGPSKIHQARIELATFSV